MYRELGGFSTAVVDVLLGAYVLGIVPGMLVGGPLPDRLGRRPLMLAAPPIAVLAGLALGIGMAVGSTWISELSARRGATATGPPAPRCR
jgi:MFS family permease